jgi:hypothetical protein
MVTYAPPHETKLPDRSIRRRMGPPLPLHTCSKEAGASADTRPTRDSERRLLLAQERVSLAASAPRLPAVENRLPLVQEMAHRRNLQAAQRGATRALANAIGKKLPA